MKREFSLEVYLYSLETIFLSDPSLFCSSNLIADTLEGFWDLEKRSYLSIEEKEEIKKLDGLEDETTAEKQIFISKDHLHALEIDSEEDELLEFRLTKGGVVPPLLQLQLVKTLVIYQRSQVILKSPKLIFLMR